MVSIKRIYEPAEKSDGFRILVDRLWPRGIKKDPGVIDKWLKDVAPSTELRKWVHAQPENWNEFEQRYLDELSKNEETAALQDLINNHKVVTLLYAAKDEVYNHARVLKSFLEKHAQA